MKNVTVDLGRVPLQHAVLVVKRMVETLDVCLPLPACAALILALVALPAVPMSQPI